mgnify:CR=1 FL=1|tara:strand:- start:282 stop:752 length:471 start_codon:yes stop_codon:yes gene_type:complete
MIKIRNIGGEVLPKINLFMDAIEMTLSNIYIQRRFVLIRLFGDKRYKVVILYTVMRHHYQKKLNQQEFDFIPTKENFYSHLYRDTSRLSLTKFIDLMVSTSVLKKERYPNDKRKWIITPTQILINEFESMHQERAEGLEKLKSDNKIISLKSLQVI